MGKTFPEFPPTQPASIARPNAIQLALIRRERFFNWLKSRGFQSNERVAGYIALSKQFYA